MTAHAIDLTTVKLLRDWLASPNMSIEEAAVVQRCITAASAVWLHRTGRGNGTIPEKSSFNELVEFDEWYDGTAGGRLFVRNPPIYSITTLQVDGQTISASTGWNVAGHIIDPGGKSLSLRGGGYSRRNYRTPHGYRFGDGVQNVHLQYLGGFPAQPQVLHTTIPASPGPYTVAIEEGWLSDEGVVFFEGGGPLELVEQDPAQGEYFVDGPGQYIFNEDDGEREILINYHSPGTPPDIITAATQMVAVNYKRRGWIDQSQVELGTPVGGTVTYRSWELPPEVRSVMELYSRIARP